MKQAVQEKEVSKVEFRDFKQAIQRRFNEMKANTLYRVQLDKDELWNLYLSSYPEGSNPVFRERTEHDCSACRAFVKNAGSMVAIVDGELQTLWDVEVGGEYQPVVDALAEFVKSCSIENVFLHPEHQIGIEQNRESVLDGEELKVRTWEHLCVHLPNEVVCSGLQIGPRAAEYTAMHDVVLRSLLEINEDAIETIQDLIAQNSLYRGAEKKSLVDAFRKMKQEFSKLTDPKAQDLFAWSQVIGPNAFVCRMRNDVIGTLLVDLSEGVDLEAAVKKFEDKVSGTNYKRPTTLVTPKMRDDAKKTLQELGLMPALERRYAKLEDINVTNVLFSDKSIRKRLGGDVFDDIPTKGAPEKNFDRVEEIGIDKFISDILPTATGLEVMFENKHAGNLVSLIAPYDLTAKDMFKWGNPFSWSYNGDVADSIKERVKQAGGNVTGDVCCRLAWHNTDDLDLHMREPHGYEIYYGNMRNLSPMHGRLDVDANGLNGIRKDPCENIYYQSKAAMRDGTYQLLVHQYSMRQTHDVGFEVEIDVFGIVHSFSHPKGLRDGQTVHVANIVVTGQEIKVVPVLPSSQASREVWGLQTQNFHPVTALMLSPNFWNGKEIGNKHFFFMLSGCVNDGSARGFYNEFLSSELEPHRRTMELVGSKMRTEESEDQMSGLGFSSTQRNSLIVRVHGSFQRTLKITF